ncbi:MAG: hypothetical protein IJK18_02000 [Clostridia bacterium]|nr:hypothetical protein [Clostridia bacterium]
MNNYEEVLEAMDAEISRLKDLKRTNLELAKKIATADLQKAGILDKDGNLVPPYNGEKVNVDDFTRGPGEINYGHSKDELKGFHRNREDLLRRLETATRGELSPLERAKGGIPDYTKTQEAEDLRDYRRFISTSSYDDVRDGEVEQYEGERGF